VKGEVESFDYLRIRWERDEMGFQETFEESDLVEQRRHKISGVNVRPQMTGASARPIRCAFLINAAGPWSGEVARLADIGKGEGLLSVPLPIVCKRRTNYLIHAPDVPLAMPALVDPSGMFCRPDCSVGFNFVCGKNPTKVHLLGSECGLCIITCTLQKDIVTKDSASDSIDYEFFHNEVWPVLAKRVPAFQNAQVFEDREQCIE